MNNLYTAQQEALHSVESYYFPRYAESNTWGKYVCNIIHDTLHIVSDVKAYLSDVASAVSNAAFAVLNRFTPAQAAYDFVCPTNIVNGQRHIVTIPRTWEKSIGDNLLFPLVTWGLTRTHAASHGETLQATVDKVVKDLLRPDENQALLTPPLAPIAFFDNIEWCIQTLTNYALSCVEDAPPDEALVAEAAGFEYKMEVMKDSSLNAFSIPGGKMVIFSGLIEEIDHSLQNHTIKEAKVTFKDKSVATVNLEGVKREDVLAALIGHEMTHAASRHLSTFSFDSFIRELMNLFGGYSENSWSYFLLSKLASRKNEFECDVTGAYLASKAGYDPRGAIYLQELFLQSQTPQVQRLNRIVEPLFTHPHGSKRLRAVFTAISTFAPEPLGKYTKWKEPQARHPYDLFHLSPALKAAEKVQENLGSGMFIV